MNFYDSLTYVWAFGRIYGLNYFTNNQNVLKITNNSFMASLIPGISFILLSLFGMHILIPDKSDYQLYSVTSVILVVEQIGIVMQFMNCFVIFVVSYIHRKGVMKFYETVYRLDDNLLNKVGINLN